jgi:DNA-directed RNA polymerase subunit RPC12/RpoP
MLPEIEMGKLQTCPNCQSSFVAGKSAAERRGGLLAAGTPQQQQPGYAQTMLADTAAQPIKYNCPRCKAPLEAPASEGGTKKNCPNCSQRHQIPAAPKPTPAPAPALNKTMMATDESAAPPPALPPIKFNCPNCKKPLEAPASEGGTKKNCQHCSQRLQVPAAPPAPAAGLNKTKMAVADEQGGWFTPGAASAPGHAGLPPMPAGKEAPSQGANPTLLTPRNVAIGAVLLVLLALVVPAVIKGGKRDNSDELAKAQIELEKLKADIELKKHEVAQQKIDQANQTKQLQDMINQMTARAQKDAEANRAALASIADKREKEKLEEKFNAAQRKLEEDKQAMEKKQQEILADLQRKLDENKRALEAAQTKQQTIIQQAPPPVVYYPPYHPRYYWPWW